MNDSPVVYWILGNALWLFAVLWTGLVIGIIAAVAIWDRIVLPRQVIREAEHAKDETP